MVEVRPFRGMLYNPSVVDDLSRVTAPPYDVIDARRREQLLARSPYNIVRLELPQSVADREFWSASASMFRAWKSGGVLTRDDRASLYVYRQDFDLPGVGRVGRTGVLASRRCMDFSSGEILPHEETFPRIRTERLNLLRACRASFSQVFAVCRDEEEEMLPLLEAAASGPPLLEYGDDEGVGHRLWRVEDADAALRLAGILAAKKLMIADGHHRYETALAYSREEPRERGEGHPRKYVSMTVFRSEDPGLVILPVHRLLRRLPVPPREAYERLRRFFHLQEVQRDIKARTGMFADRMEKVGRPCFMMVTREGAMQVVLQEGVDPAGILEGPGSERWKGLEVHVLHSLALEACLGLDPKALAEEGGLCFTPWESAALDAVAGEEAEAAFLVRANRVEEVWEIAESGERMPHKSTYFYPKLPSGLVIFDHETAFS